MVLAIAPASGLCDCYYKVSIFVGSIFQVPFIFEHKMDSCPLRGIKIYS
jgi:hypothetical protein